MGRVPQVPANWIVLGQDPTPGTVMHRGDAAQATVAKPEDSRHPPPTASAG